MKKAIIVFALALIVTAPVYSADYLRIGVDSLIAGKPNQLIPLYVERTCPEPEQIMEHSQGFEIRSHGDVTWSFVDYSIPSYYYGWFMFGGVFTPIDLDGVSPDTFFIGGSSFQYGMPIVQDTLFWSLWFDMGAGEGEMCFDSAFAPPAGTWKFSGLTCGVIPGYPDRPSLVDKYGNDFDPASDGVCITVFDPQCVAPTILNTPSGDVFEIGYWMTDTTWQFDADPGEMLGEPSQIEMWSVVEGPGEIDSTGLYSAYNHVWPTGEYDVTIEAYNECGYGSYSFTLLSHNECGNTNGADDVDIDDIVAIISYIFMGGQSIPTSVGDVDCSGEIDIDDAVYLLYYIFSGASAPCDPDGDGVPDCWIVSLTGRNP